MEACSLKFIAGACAGELVGDSGAAEVRRICTDSRRIQRGDLFIALRGERFDGHAFLREVAEKGAAAVLAERAGLPAGWTACPAILVKDTRRALGRIASYYRMQFGIRIVAVGGSNGKTTTKELIASVLRQKFNTLWSEGSFNNDIGVPLTLLQLEKSHEAAVMEVGTNHPGELMPLVKMIQPRHGVITNIGREHLEFFRDVAGVATEEGTLAQMLPVEGKLFVNGDDEWTERIVVRTHATAVRVGFGARCDWRARNIRLDGQGATFRLEAPRADFSGNYRINLVGRHQVTNALFAVAIGAEFGLEPAEIERGLSECQPPRMRMQVWESNGVRLLDDTYNANADSMIAALETLQALPCKGRRVAVLGDMAELGAQSEPAHEEVGRRAAELGIGQLFAVGTMAPILARGARAGGLNRVLEFSDVDSAASPVRQFLKSGDVVLLKASRASRMERIVEALKQ